MTTMRDVARVAGVSAKTVSRVFNEDPYVTEETRDRVRWAMEKPNYVPNMLARSFQGGRGRGGRPGGPGHRQPVLRRDDQQH